MADTTPDWERLYQQALRETDLTSLLERVHAAEEAICRRWQELEGSPDRKNELEGINQAVVRLFAIKMEKLKFPLSFFVLPFSAARLRTVGFLCLLKSILRKEPCYEAT